MSGFGILAIYAVIMITATLIFTKKRKKTWKDSALEVVRKIG
ncbi:MAG: hypothetical protein ACLTUZ_15365 [Sellimonas intestinalis]